MPGKSTVLVWLANKVRHRVSGPLRARRELWADGLFDETLEIADDASNDVKVGRQGRRVGRRSRQPREHPALPASGSIPGNGRPRGWPEEVRGQVEVSGTAPAARLRSR